jgi:hypothetical protein
MRFLWQPTQCHHILERLTLCFELRSKMSTKEMCALRNYKQLMPITHEAGFTVVQQWNTVATINEYVT